MRERKPVLTVTTMRPLTTAVSATAPNVAQVRRALRRWLGQVLADEPEAVDDLTLATSEALENAVDHAFADTPEVGTMALQATDDGDHITIVVCDNGHWQPPDPDAGYRGRGIDLMARLADTSRVHPGAGGTAVTLIHHRVPAPRERLD